MWGWLKEQLTGNIPGEILGGAAVALLIFARKRISDFLMYLSPAYRRWRLVRSGLVKSLDTEQNRRLSFVPLKNREPKDMILFTDKGVLIPGVYIVHGSVKSGKWMWIVKALLDPDAGCDPYEIVCDVNSSSTTVTSELTKYLKGVEYSLSGVPEHKVFVVELSDTVTDRTIGDMREALEKYREGLKCKRNLTFILKTAGFVDVEGNAVCLEALSPDECLEFVKHNVWGKDASQNVCKAHLGVLSGSQLSENDPTVHRQLSRSLWISTLGQPGLLRSLIDVKKADIHWKERLDLIAANRDKQYALEEFMSFLTMMALLADSEGSGTSKSERKLSLRSLVGACGISTGGYPYEHFAKVVRKIYRYNIQGRKQTDISRSHLVCFEESKERDLGSYFFDNRFEASALLLKCCNFGMGYDYSAAMTNFISPALMNRDLGIDEEDRRRAGRNLARAIVENLTWNKWEATYARFEEDWPFADYVTEIHEAFREEYMRLARENSIFAKLERCADTLEDTEICPILEAVVTRKIEDDRVYAETIARGLRIAAMNGYASNVFNALKIDFARLNDFAKSDKIAEGADIVELLSAIAIFSLVNEGILRRNFSTVVEGFDKFNHLSELMESLCARLVKESQVLQLLEAANEYATTGDLSEERRIAINKLISEIVGSANQYLSDAICFALNEWGSEKICVWVDGRKLRGWSGIIVRRHSYAAELTDLLSSATAENWGSVRKRLDTELKPDRDNIYQNIKYVMKVISVSSLVPREELAGWHDRFLSRQKDWYAMSRRNRFICQFLLLGKSIAEFGCSEAVNRYLDLFESVFWCKEAAGYLCGNPEEFRDFDRLLFLLSNRPLDEMSEQKRTIIRKGMLLSMVYSLFVDHMPYSEQVKKASLYDFSNSYNANGVFVPKTYAELLLCISQVLINEEFIEEAYPETEECCRRAVQLLIDGFKDQTENKQLYADFSLMHSWLCEVMELSDDCTKDLVRKTLERIVRSLPQRNLCWYGLNAAEGVS